MKFKAIYVILIFIICFSFSAVSAVDLNETQEIQLDEVDENSYLTADDFLAVEDYDSNNNLQDYLDDSILNLSNNDNNIILQENNNKDNIMSATGSLGAKNNLYAVIDFGSNTIKMEVYELKKSGKIKSVFDVSENSVTARYCENNKLSPKGIDELVSILEDFQEICDLTNVKCFYVFATASLRNIDNGEEVVSTVKAKSGIDIHILEELQEAYYSFNSVKDKELTTDDGIVIDLGGGSCEVIDFVNKAPVTMESMPIGSNSIYEQYVYSMFPDENETAEIQKRVISELKKLEITNSTQRYDLFGVGGSIKTIKKVLISLNYMGEDTNDIPVTFLDSLLDEFKENSQQNFQKILDVNSERINTLVPGIIITKTIADYFNISTLHFCKNGVREGVVSELIENDTKNSPADWNMSVSDIDITPDLNPEIVLVLPENATGYVEVKINDNTYTGSIDNNVGLIVLPKLESGNYSAKVTYSGDENYISQKQKINIHVKSVMIDAYDMVRGFNSGYDYQVKLMDECGNAIENKLITFTVGQKQYYAMTNGEGIANFKDTLNVGKYSITIQSPLFEQSITKNLKIVKRIQNNKNLNVYYNSNQKYKIKIIGDNGAAESQGKSVKVLIDNKQHTYKTDKNGFITINLNKDFKVGKHTIKVQYKGDTVQNTITIKHAISSQKIVKVKKSAKKIVIKVKLKSSNKNALKNKKINIKIKGKTYAVKTNKNGIAKLTLNKNKFNRGKYTVKTTYLKEVITTSLRVY